MKRNIIVLFIYVLLNTLSAYSQNNTNGFIITPANDTLWGTISDGKMFKSKSLIWFRKEGLGNEIKFNPCDIKAYSNSEGYYVSAITDVDYSPTEKSMLRESPEPDMKRDTLFLKVFLKGAATLLFFRDNDLKPHYFINIGDSIFTELINYSYSALAVNTEYNTDYVRTVPKYRGILTYYFADCPTALRLVNDLDFSEKALINIFKKYNQCHPETGVTYETRSKLFYEIRVIAGVGKPKMFYIHDSDPVFSDINYQPQVSLGTGINIKMLGRLKALSFNNELLVSRNKCMASVSYSNGIVDNYNEAHMSSLDFSLNSMVKAAFPVKMISPYFTFGMRNSLVYFLDNVLVRNSTIGGTTTSSISPLLEFYKHYAFGLVLGLGVDYKDFGFELRYNPKYGMDIDKRVIVSYSTSSLNVLISYRFKSNIK
jgi:hypothetical protein